MILEEVMYQWMFYKNQGVALTWLVVLVVVLYAKCNKNSIISEVTATGLEPRTT